MFGLGSAAGDSQGRCHGCSCELVAVGGNKRIMREREGEDSTRERGVRKVEVVGDVGAVESRREQVRRGCHRRRMGETWVIWWGKMGEVICG